MKSLNKILITGGHGQLAYDLQRVNSPLTMKMVALNRNELDITNFDLIEKKIVEFKPDIVINAAAYTQVDRAEQESLQAMAVNRDGAKNLAIVCEKYHCPLVHVSTDYVFDGQKDFPYREIDSVNPISVYGESKLRGEEFVQQYCEKHIILRVSAVFGVHGLNFVKTILRLAKEKEELRIVSDQWTCPTPTIDIAETILSLCQAPQWGIFHYCGSPAASWYEFAKLIIENARLYEDLRVKNIQAIASKEYITLAQRPKYSVLNCEKIKTTFGIEQKNWQKGLQDVIKSLYSA